MDGETRNLLDHILKEIRNSCEAVSCIVLCDDNGRVISQDGEMPEEARVPEEIRPVISGSASIELLKYLRETEVGFLSEEDERENLYVLAIGNCFCLMIFSSDHRSHGLVRFEVSKRRDELERILGPYDHPPPAFEAAVSNR